MQGKREGMLGFLKRAMLFTAFLMIVLILLEILLLSSSTSMDFTRMIFFSSIFGLAHATTYRFKKVSQEVEDFQYLSRTIEEGKWEIINRDESSFILQARFNYPYNFFIKDKVYVEYDNNIATIRGPASYVERLVWEVKGRNKWVILSRYALVLGLLIILAIPLIRESGLYWNVKTSIHNSRSDTNRQIEATVLDRGNRIENINNYGSALESENHIYYVSDHLNLVSVDKDFQNQIYIMENPSGSGIGNLNLIGDWIYYTRGDELYRVRTNGNDREKLYDLGLLLDVNIVGDSIYFINFNDSSNIYRMDINGQNLERFLDIPAMDIGIFNERLYFSYINDDRGYIESIELNGKDRRLEIETIANNLLMEDNYYYYIGEDYNLRRSDIDSKEEETLIDDKVSSYIIIDDEIFYSLHYEDAGYPGQGLYRSNLDGGESSLILNTEMVESLSYVGESLLFYSADEDYLPTLRRLDLSSGKFIE